MSRAEAQLVKDEKILYRTALHWSHLVIPCLVGLLLFALVLPLLWPIWAYLERKKSEFVLTNKRIVIYTGVLSNTSFELQLNKIEGVNVHQGIIDRLFGSGSLIFSGTGGSKHSYADVDKPFEFRKAVLEQIDSK